MSVSSDVHGSDYIVTRINTTVAVSIDVSFFFIFTRSISKAGAQIHFHSVLNVFIYKIAFIVNIEQNQCAG